MNIPERLKNQRVLAGQKHSHLAYLAYHLVQTRELDVPQEKKSLKVLYYCKNKFTSSIRIVYYEYLIALHNINILIYEL